MVGSLRKVSEGCFSGVVVFFQNIADAIPHFLLPMTGNPAMAPSGVTFWGAVAINGPGPAVVWVMLPLLQQCVEVSC